MHKDGIILDPSHIRIIGKAWAGNSVNVSALRASGLITVQGSTWTAFYNNEGVGVLRQYRGNNEYEQKLCCKSMPWDAHRTISLGVDAAGRVHVAWGGHGATGFIARSKTSDLAEGLQEACSLETDSKLAITYPGFVHLGPGRNPLLLLRYGRYDAAMWFVRRLCSQTMAWIQDCEPFLNGVVNSGWNSGPYVDAPAMGFDGRIHLTYCWRLTPSAADIGPVGNIGLDYLVSDDDLRTLRSDRGVALTPPVTPASSQRIWPVSLGEDLMNQCCLAVRPDGVPVLATIWSDQQHRPQYRLLWKEKQGWRMSTVSAFTTCYQLNGYGTLPTPHGRPKLLIDRAGRCLLLFRSSEYGSRLMMRVLFPPKYDLNEAVDSVLWPEPLGFYEPVVDHGAWDNNGTLSLYVQHCAQPSNVDGEHQRLAAVAVLATWTPQTLANAGIE